MRRGAARLLWVVVSSGRRNTLSQMQEMEWTGDGSEMCSRVQRGGQGGVVEPLAVRIRSSTEWLGNSNERSRETLGSKPEPNEI
jgi:hypothetical protein